jgi:hypothetical protein
LLMLPVLATDWNIRRSAASISRTPFAWHDLTGLR